MENPSLLIFVRDEDAQEASHIIRRLGLKIESFNGGEGAGFEFVDPLAIDSAKLVALTDSLLHMPFDWHRAESADNTAIAIRHRTLDTHKLALSGLSYGFVETAYETSQRVKDAIAKVGRLGCIPSLGESV